MANPKVRAYAVAVGFGDMNSSDGTIAAGSWLATSPENAAAGLVAAHIQASGITMKLQGVSVHELTEEALRFMLAQITTGGKAGAVVPLRAVEPAQDFALGQQTQGLPYEDQAQLHGTLNPAPPDGAA